MLDIAFHLSIIIGFILLMEGVAWVSHKYLMHGCLWSLHKSHHEPRLGAFEKNDWFGVFFSLPSMALIYVGVNHWAPALSAGIGILGYGLIYFFLHDILVHKRINTPLRPKKGYLARIIQAHRLHHAVESKEGCVSFGFIFAPSPQALKAMLKTTQEAKLRAPQKTQAKKHSLKTNSQKPNSQKPHSLATSEHEVKAPNAI